MSRYRPVDTRLWGDRKFLTCSDDGRMLWLFLLTCPSLPIPGLIIAGEAAMAEHIGWTAERLREGFRDLQKAGLRVVRDGRVTWLPKALEYQPPSNLNVVKGWSKTWDDVPECEAKIEIWESLKNACKAYSSAFTKLYRVPFRCPEETVSVTVTTTNTNTNTNTNTRESAAPAPSVSGPAGKPWDPNIPRAKFLLAEAVYANLSALRISLAKELGLPEQEPLRAITPATSARLLSDLIARVEEEGPDAPAACARILAKAAHEARDTQKITWVGEVLFKPDVWRRVREYVPAPTRKKPALRFDSSTRIKTDDEVWLGPDLGAAE